MSKIGILGGTFNPIHLGHLIIAQQVLEYFKLKQVIFIPNYIPPHRRREKLISVKDRYQMIKLAIRGNPKFKVSHLELNRRGLSYTFDTICQLKKISPKDQFYFITGSDALIKYKWHKLDELLSKLKALVVVERPGFPKIKLTKILKSLKLRNKKRVTIIKIPTLDISSNEIRERIRKGKSVKYLVPELVERYTNKKLMVNG